MKSILRLSMSWFLFIFDIFKNKTLYSEYATAYPLRTSMVFTSRENLNPRIECDYCLRSDVMEAYESPKKKN